MVRLIIGRAGTGKTSHIHSIIRENMGKGISGQILLVPEQYSHSTERQLGEFCGDSLSLYAEVLTFRRLCSRVLSEEGGLADTPMDDSGRIILIKGLLSDLNEFLGPFKGFHTRPAMIKNLMTLIDELKSYRVFPAELLDLSEGLEGEGFAKKLKDIALVLEGYSAELERQAEGGCDTNDVFSRVAERLEGSRFFAGREVFADAFAGFDPKELAIIERIAAGAKSLTISLCADPADLREDSGYELFSPTKKTLRAIERICGRLKIEFEIIPLYENKKHSSPALGLIEAGFFDYSAGAKEDPQAGVELCVCSDIYDECALAASRVAELVESDGLKCRDFAVVARDISAYEAAITQAFGRAGLPVFIDRTEDILKKPPAAHIIHALECISENFSFEALFAYLRCGFSGLSAEETDLFENYCYKWSLSGEALSPEKKLFLPAEDNEGGELLERLEQIKNRAMAPLFELKRMLSGEKSMPGLTERLVFFLEGQGFEERISERMEFLKRGGHIRLAAEYSMLWEAITSVLDQCLLAQNIRDIGTREFYELIVLALSQKRIGVIPTALDGVRVGEAERIRGDGVKCAIILGANEGNFPLVRLAEGLISDSEREILMQNDITLAPTGEIRAFEEQYIIYQALCLPSERLIVTAPERAGDGSPLSPSFLFSRIEQLTGVRRINSRELGFLPYAFSREALFEYAMGRKEKKESLKQALRLEGESETLERARFSLWGSREGIGRELAQKLYGKSPLVSASAVEVMASCRFESFAMRGLSAKPLKKQKFEAPQVGDFVHAVLEEVCRAVEERGGWKKAELDEILAIGRKSAGEYENLWFGSHPENGRTRHLFKRLSRFIERMIKNIYEELSESLFEPIFFELDFSEKGDLPPVAIGEGTEGELRLRGRVDRVDGFEREEELYIRVIDYKTGGKPFDLTEILNGMGMQMLIYLFALEKSGLGGRKVLPAGVLYIPGMSSQTVDLPRNASDAEIEKNMENGMRRMGLVLDDEDIVRAMEPAMGRRFIPVKAGKSGYDAYSSVASPGQMEKLKEHVEKMLCRFGSELKRGYTQANPYRRGPQRTACDYCEYRPVCLFDETAGDDRFRSIRGVSRNDFWESIQGGAEE